MRNEFMQEFNSNFGTQLKQNNEQYTMLIQLFHDFIVQSFQTSDLYKSIMNKILETEDDIQEVLTDEGKQLFKRWETYRDELSNFEAEQSFIYGYCFAKQLDIEKQNALKNMKK